MNTPDHNIGKQPSETPQQTLVADPQRAELALFKAIVDASSEPIAISDPQGKLVYINSAHEKLFGRSLEQARRINYRDYYPPESLTIINQEVVPALESGRSWEGILDVWDAHGRRFPLWERADSIRDHEGNLLYGFGLMHDVTQVREHEKSLAESEQRYRALFENNLNPMAIIDAQGRYLEANPAFLDFVELTGDQLSLMSVFDFAPPGGLADQKTAHQPKWETGGVIETDYDINGVIKTLELSITPIQYSGAAAIMGIGKDITERKRAEAELINSRERLNLILNSLTDMVLETDGEMTILWANQEALKYNPQAIGKKCYQAFGSGTRTDPCPGCPCRQALFSGQLAQSVIHRLVTTGQAGESYWHNIGIPVKNAQGSVIRLIEVSRNVTHEKQMELALLESNGRYAEAQRLAAMGSWVWDLETKTLTWSDEVYRIFGVAAGSFLPSVAAFEAAIHPDDKADFLARRAKMLEDKQYAEIEHRIVRPTGEIRHVQERAQLVLKAQGQVQRVIGTVQDITERKLLEAEKAKIAEQLRQMQKVASLKRMAGAIAHRFNNRLAVVIGNLELALEVLPPGQAGLDYLTESLLSARQAAEVSRLMLTYLGQSLGERRAISLSAHCRQCLGKLAALMPKTARLITTFPASGPMIDADPEHLSQILTHIVTNAWESLGQGGGRISVAVSTVAPADIPAARRFPVNWQPRQSDYACIEVTDTGCGISAANMDNLFDPFFSTQFSGRGLGLAVTLGLVQTHDGGVAASSRPGQGSVFRVYFPLSAKAEPEAPAVANAFPPPSPDKPTVKTGRTVLVVDDEELVRNFTKTLIQRLGYEVITAGDGVAAIELFRRHQAQIRLVLTDLSMPRLNGLELLAALRQIEPDLPVILVSGYDESQALQGEKVAKPQMFLAKPYKRQELEQALAALLGNQ